MSQPTPAQNIRDARKQASDTITAAVRQAMIEFHAKTGLSLTGVKAEIVVHQVLDKTTGRCGTVEADAVLMGINLTTNADSL